jgi:hypothetical protein
VGSFAELCLGGGVQVFSKPAVERHVESALRRREDHAGRGPRRSRRASDATAVSAGVMRPPKRRSCWAWGPGQTSPHSYRLRGAARAEQLGEIEDILGALWLRLLPADPCKAD